MIMTIFIVIQRERGKVSFDGRTRQCIYGLREIWLRFIQTISAFVVIIRISFHPSKIPGLECYLNDSITSKMGLFVMLSVNNQPASSFVALTLIYPHTSSSKRAHLKTHSER